MISQFQLNLKSGTMEEKKEQPTMTIETTTLPIGTVVYVSYFLYGLLSGVVKGMHFRGGKDYYNIDYKIFAEEGQEVPEGECDRDRMMFALPVGTIVLVNQMSANEYFRKIGKITSVNGDKDGYEVWHDSGDSTYVNAGGYDIIYEDGEEEKGVSRIRVCIAPLYAKLNRSVDCWEIRGIEDRVEQLKNQLKLEKIKTSELLLENELIKNRLQQLENLIDPEEILLENELIKDRLRQLENKHMELKFEHLRTKTSFEELGELQFKTEDIIKTRLEQLEMKLAEDKIRQRQQFIYILIVLIAFIGSRLI